MYERVSGDGLDGLTVMTELMELGAGATSRQANMVTASG